ncbi:MAG: cytidine deaminase [Bifidobacteriaceae bacterium]|jgi:cytidine deaminase|nr:cytidine deaminase [Bifidobacteriaceae bacterium]
MTYPNGDPQAAGAAAQTWSHLLEQARQAARRAYAPYSDYAVGAAAVASSGGSSRLVVGCNVENASYGLTLCAECSLISALHLSGGGRLTRFVCVAMAWPGQVGEPHQLVGPVEPSAEPASGGPEVPPDVVMPCGRCRQLLCEHGGPDLIILTPLGERRLADLLPQAFGADDLKALERP